LVAHYNAQMQMSMSGIDYYGSDIGGFWRESPDAALGDNYTRWLANALWTDTPVRPHTFNVDAKKHRETSPNRIGDVPSNLLNIRRRYGLLPYYYSLAHRAHDHGEPVVPPPFFYFPDDANLRTLGGQKLIGRDLMVALLLESNAETRDVYLPKGTWVNFNTGEQLDSRGQWFREQRCTVGGAVTVPAYARQGAIIPMARVSDATMNSEGLTASGRVDGGMVVRVYPSPVASSFTLVEDDGRTLEYLRAAMRKTVLSQRIVGGATEVVIEPAAGDYRGAPAERNVTLEVHAHGATPITVTLNGQALPRIDRDDAWNSGLAGWQPTKSALVRVNTGVVPVTSRKTLLIRLAPGGS
jgi:alpha-glucosidase